MARVNGRLIDQGEVMKLKETHTNTLPQCAKDSICGLEFLREVMQKVHGEHLRVENPTSRPAEHYIQVGDESYELEPNCWGVAVDLTRASLKDGRFYTGAVETIYALYQRQLEQTLVVGQRVQLMCSVGLDKPAPGQDSTLIETKAGWVEGKATPITT